jgi:hypothetical protein
MWLRDRSRLQRNDDDSDRHAKSHQSIRRFLPVVDPGCSNRATWGYTTAVIQKNPEWP